MGNANHSSVETTPDSASTEPRNSPSPATESWAEAIEMCLAHLERDGIKLVDAGPSISLEVKPQFPEVAEPAPVEAEEAAEVEGYAQAEAAVEPDAADTAPEPEAAHEEAAETVAEPEAASEEIPEEVAPEVVAASPAEAAPEEQEAVEVKNQAETAVEEETAPPETVEEPKPETEAAEAVDVRAWPKLEDFSLEEFEFEEAAEEVVSFEPVKAIEEFKPVAPAAPQAGVGGGPVVAELVAARAEIRRLETRCENLEGLHHEASKTLARRQADFDNYRRRTEREREEMRYIMTIEVVKPLLPVIDNLLRALATQTSVNEDADHDPQHFVEGVQLIAQQLDNVVSEVGVEVVPSIGEPFDPVIHEAVALEATNDYPPQTVTQEILRGYRLGERLLRPAMVKVAVQTAPAPPDES
jgi:molecular chaperone GrpE